MLKLTGKGKAFTCNGVSRRDFLQAGTLGAIGFGLPQWFAAQAAGAVKADADDRACIMIFNLGAPSNMDLWDMKPDAPARGPRTVQARVDRLAGDPGLRDPAPDGRGRRQVLAGAIGAPRRRGGA